MPFLRRVYYLTFKLGSQPLFSIKKMINPFKFVQGVKQEAYKVTWPTTKEVLIGASMVFVLATIAAIFFLLLDQIYRFLLDIILTINF